MFVLTGLLFVLPPYLQAVLGNDAFGTGLRLLPMMGGLMVAARARPPLVERVGPRPGDQLAGCVVLAFAALLGTRTTVDSGYGFTALWLSIAGLGFGFAMCPRWTTALDTLPRDRAGSGSGLLMTVRQVGQRDRRSRSSAACSPAASPDRLDTGGLAGAASPTRPGSRWSPRTR